MVRRRRCHHGDVGQHRLYRGDGPDHRPTDRGYRHDHCSGPRYPHHLLLADASPASAGALRGGADRARPHLCAGNDGAAGYSLHTGHLDHNGALDRDRGGLHHPCDSSLQGGVHPSAGPGEGSGPDPGDHWFGAVGLSPDHGTGDRSARVLAAGGLPAVRHHGGDHDRLLPDCFHRVAPARDASLGCVPEHATALDGGARMERPRRSYRGHSQA